MAGQPKTRAKTEPTDLDREAARLFTPATGMRYLVNGEWCRVVQVHADGDWTACTEEKGDLGPVAFRDSGSQSALDIDDQATCGCMLAQVEDVAGVDVHLAKTYRIMPVDPTERDYCIWAAYRSPNDCIDTGKTRGAALVAAMRNLRDGR